MNMQFTLSKSVVLTVYNGLMTFAMQGNKINIMNALRSSLFSSSTQPEINSWNVLRCALLSLCTLLVGIALAVQLSTIALAQSPVLQRGYDAGVTGATLSETTLNTANVTPSTFGLVFTLPVDDVIFAQPLYVPNVVINQVTYNVLYVATMNDTLYAFDADKGGAPLWRVNLASLVGATSVPIGNFVFSGDRGIVGNLGVLSTPVIDLSTNTLYVVACDLEGVTPSTPNGNMVYRLHAIDIKTGAARPGSGVLISGNYGRVTFDARYLLQRQSLVLVDNQIVFGFAAMQLEFASGFSGWVMAYDKNTLAQTGVLATVAAGNSGGGVWQSGRPPVVDSSGLVYVFVGNGFGGGYDGINNFSESVLKLDPTQGLKLIDWFTPSDWSALDSGDLDLSGSGPMLIPGTNLIAGGGKAGDLYVLNTSNLGKYNASDSQIVQKLNFPSEIKGGPVYWQRSTANGGPLMYNWGESDSLKAFAFNGTTFASTPISQGLYTNQIYPGGILTLSANGEMPNSGIVWATTAASGDAENNPPVPGVLHAFNASNISQELWNSTLNDTRDGFGNFAKFVPPLVNNGRVYVATWSNQVAVYGLLSGTAPDFQISASPTALSVLPGQSANYTVNVAALNGFASVVSLGISGAPSGVTASLTPSSVTGSGTATLQITAATNAPLGKYTLTVTGTSGAVTHSANVSLSILSSTAPTVDMKAFGNNTTNSNTISTSGVSTSGANELLLAFIATDYISGTNTTVTGMTGGGLTWSLVQRTNVQSGTSEIWRAFAPTTLSNVTVTATLSNSVISSMYVASFSGVDTTGAGSGAIGATGSANSSSGAPTASLVTTRDSSIVLGVGNDFDNAISRTPGSGQTVVHQYLTPAGDTYWVQQLDAPVPIAGSTTTINDTAPTTDRFNLSLVEVRAPLGATYSISGTLTPSSLTAGSIVSLSGATSATATTDASGNFTFANLANGSYIVTPSKSGVTFTPASQSVTINGSNVTGVNFSAMSSSSSSISGTLTPSSLTAGSTVSLSGAASATVTADASGNFTFANLANGSYAVTPNNPSVTFAPASQSVTINGSNVTGVNFSATSSSSGIAIDAVVSKDNATGSKTISSPTFSTAAGNELLLAFIATDYLSGSNTTVTAVSGGGLTWTLVARANAQRGTAEIWRTFAPAALTNQTVTATLSQNVSAAISVMSFSGVDATGTNGANAIGATATASSRSGAPTASLTTTRGGSLVVGVGNDYDNPISRTLGSGQTLIHQYLTPLGDTYWMQRSSAVTPAAGTTVTINDTSPTTDRYNLAIAEIRSP
ncbi:hypothetical protein [Methylomicrobium lacus]|uniref:hypothetical protein n=1 Tax=Methylomicrobium lacus TaxID=136992 RepID=UPI00045EC519|nr:hypothetical protein [Methylomicrobium lacus]